MATRPKEKDEYAQAEDYPEMIGKRAIINPVQHYCGELHGHTGTISEVYGRLFLNFDVPARAGTAWEMRGVYLTPDAYKVI